MNIIPSFIQSKIKILYINENSKKKLQDCNSQDIYKTLSIMKKKYQRTSYWFHEMEGKNSKNQFVLKICSNLLVFTAVLVEFSDSSSFSQLLGIDFFSFVNSDIQLVFKGSFF
jgi:hypothetical protein